MGDLTGCYSMTGRSLPPRHPTFEYLLYDTRFKAKIFPDITMPAKQSYHSNTGRVNLN